jgi:hypothetical protein
VRPVEGRRVRQLVLPRDFPAPVLTELQNRR